METGDVIISTEDYHAGELIIDEELAKKMFAAAKIKTKLQEENVDDIPVFEVRLPEDL